MTTAWITPVSDRTKEDVKDVVRLNAKISKYGWDKLTPQEQKEWTSGLKACLNSSDLNRMEIDTVHLREKLYSYGYGLGAVLHKTDWRMSDFPTVSEIERVRHNIQTLIDCYHQQSVSLPANLEKSNYQMINALERNLQDIYDMIDLMVSQFNYCGTFVCGQDVIL